MSKTITLLIGAALGALFAIAVGYFYFVWNAKVIEHGCSFIIESKEKQAHLESAISRSGISHKVDLSGQIWYACEDEARVKDIAFAIMGRGDVSP